MTEQDYYEGCCFNEVEGTVTTPFGKVMPTEEFITEGYAKIMLSKCFLPQGGGDSIKAWFLDMCPSPMGILCVRISRRRAEELAKATRTTIGTY